MTKDIQTKTAKKIGLFVAINMLIGSVIGIGIFFKNDGVFQTNGGNSVFVLIGWILGAIISFFTAICFGEVGSCSRSRSGLGDWCSKLVSKGFGTFIKIIQPLFYFGILIFAISNFASEAIFNIFDASQKVNFGIIMLVGMILFIAFMIFNFISTKASTRLQMIINFFKFIPIVFIIIFGIYYGIVNSQTNMFITNHYPLDKPVSNNNNFATVLISLPSILFAFDSFVSIGNFSKDMNNPQKNVPLAVIIAMLTVGIVYILVTIGQILTSCGNVYDIFNLLSDNLNVRNTIRIIVSIFIFIAVTGVLNGFSGILIRSCQSLIDEQKIAYYSKIDLFAHKLIKSQNELKTGFVIALGYYLILFIALIIPSSILNTDVFIDGVSNFPTTFIFSIYATVILFGMINRKTKKVDVIKIKIFLWCAPIAIVGCYLVFFFQVFYTFTSLTIINPFGQLTWGLFATNGYITYNWYGTVAFGLYFILMLIYFIINKILLNKAMSKPMDAALINKHSFKIDHQQSIRELNV